MVSDLLEGGKLGIIFSNPDVYFPFLDFAAYVCGSSNAKVEFVIFDVNGRAERYIILVNGNNRFVRIITEIRGAFNVVMRSRNNASQRW